MTFLPPRLWMPLTLASTLWLAGCSGEPTEDITSPVETTAPVVTPTMTPGTLTPTTTPGTLTPTTTPGPLTPTTPPDTLTPTPPDTPSSPSPTQSPTPTGTPTGTPGLDQDNDGFSTAEGDCNDQDATINPDATEVTDGKDNNCNGQTDELANQLDDDGDG